uniref:Uncharacterized protein n=1 Tax=Alexandrium catenella TaxID=2925 RepID=A0A7S1LNT9_ALECA
MVFAWSMASHVTSAGPHEGAFADAGVPNREVSSEDLEDMLPMEPLWDILLPLSGLSIGILGLQLTLGLSLAEPLLLLLLPSMRGALREFDERLLSWHLGSIFGHPMLAAQVVVARAEKQHRERCIIVGLGALVNAYALGALGGSAMRSFIDLHTDAGSLRRLLRAAVVFGLVLANLTAVARNGELLGESEEEVPFRPSQEELDQEVGLVPRIERSLSRLQARVFWSLQKVVHEVGGALSVARACGAPLLARALATFALSVVIGPAPVAPIDAFAKTPLKSGFNVLWFDVAHVLASGVLAPLVVSRPLSRTAAECLDFGFGVGCAVCCLATAASVRAEPSTFALAMLAGLALSVSAGLAGSVLAMRMLEVVKEREAGVALGWGLLAGGFAEYMGTRLGSMLFRYFSWYGVTGVAGAACTLGWWMSRTPASKHERTLSPSIDGPERVLGVGSG